MTLDTLLTAGTTACPAAGFLLGLIGVAFALVVSLAAAYVAVGATIALRFTRAHRVAPFRSPALDAARVRFPARDGRVSIEAWYLAAKPRRGAVVFVHGKDSCRGDELKAPTLALARQFVAAGVSVLMIDLRGHGRSGPARLSYGARERFDVLGAVDWLLDRGYAGGRIGVLGASMGAATALLAARDEPAIGALVVDSPFADFATMIERQYRKLSGNLPTWLLPGALAVGRLLTGDDLRSVRPIDAAAASRGRPTLVIHAAGDRFIPAQDAHDIAQAAGAELWITESRHHIGSYREAPQAYAERVIGFLVQHLLADAGARTPLRLAACNDGPLPTPRGALPLAA